MSAIYGNWYLGLDCVKSNMPSLNLEENKANEKWFHIFFFLLGLLDFSNPKFISLSCESLLERARFGYVWSFFLTVALGNAIDVNDEINLCFM